MCGVTGFSGTFDYNPLQAMSESISHRGPDDAGILLIEKDGVYSAGLAHRRLSIIDLSAEGRQPMSVDCERCGVGTALPPDKRLWLTYNGEIYNYRQLRSELESKGHRFHSLTDSEVLLHLFAEEGPAMLKRLNGIFAFAIYDGRDRRGDSRLYSGDLFLARDGIGVKPLYYSETDRGFLFASELKALLTYPDLARDLDLAALHYYLTYLWAPAPYTPLKAIKKFEPGEAMIVRAGHIVKRWSFYDLPCGQPWMGGSEAEVAARLGESLEAAVDRQMVADVPVGAFLSGGLDSSAVVFMMRKIRPDERIQCYCIGFADDADMEGSLADLPYARRVAKRLGVDLKVIEVQPDMINNLERMLYHLDEPQADPAPINALLIAEQARSDGIKVLMSGVGGDDIFSGYRRHLALQMERFWLWMPQTARASIATLARKVANGNGATKWMGNPSARRFSKLLSHIDLPDEERLVSYFYWSEEKTRRSLYSPDMAVELRDVDTAEPLLKSLRRIPDERDPLNRMLYLEAKHFLADHNLNYTDKTSMAAGVEVRVPLLDLELVDFAARIPPQMKQKGQLGKAIFKKSMEPYLPHDVIYRPKSGFGAPLRRWLRHELRDMVEDLLSRNSLNQRGLFDPSAVRHIIELDRAGRIDGTYTIFSLICLELWCQLFVDRRAPVF